jgi:hypothetical protein
LWSAFAVAEAAQQVKRNEQQLQGHHYDEMIFLEESAEREQGEIQESPLSSDNLQRYVVEKRLKTATSKERQTDI